MWTFVDVEKNKVDHQGSLLMADDRITKAEFI